MTGVSEVAPKPIVVEDGVPVDSSVLDDDSNDYFKVLGIPIKKRTPFNLLRFVQKYSTWPMSVYFPLHAINVLIVPAVSVTDVPNEVLMMVRELLPPSYITTNILVGTLSLHLAAGVMMRFLRLWNTKGSNNSSKLSQGNSNDVGFFKGLLTQKFIGIRSSIKKTSPQVLSGYILTPLLAYHLFVMVYGPRLADFEVDFSYVKWLLQQHDSMIKWIGGIIPLIMLIGSGTFHISTGAIQFLSLKSKTIKRSISNGSKFLIAAGVISVIRLATCSFDSFNVSQYTKVFGYLRF
ncbi:hypothetical protein Kpol_1012p3 [Vanderwaltozyma polyspora DSM 70294]|uniref:Mitochondrial adapter protein MCP1 transmembrane domain-containing protein n=1 Tax=Vanderwaltozyma polyspora (strain ATCC 22028 / DSM 70294 / BCRC 21397 / CBS 2163 / NBRC 10782 / NRRL Y-8283 / UCD 57-17) TaxID=436907 RepID=A7TS77_VANPO|nr:uncharacterized protein Kpol_1012p3 [Vanderwaltozyma polyspora DSM 70294]EDO14876.1 hypothetical protein Kpol_1012p3 [Vanderwaltozyma polyspora DSM 70294]